VIGDKSPKYVVLEAYTLMATKQKQNIERAIQTLMSLIQGDKEYVPALLGLANAYLLLKQVPKARNNLRHVAKLKTNPDFASEFERSWLLLADLYIQGGKYDLAQDLCKKTLENNKSSGKAWEQLGLVMEKEQSYRDAADHYEQAWKCVNESSPSVGFKLAFNYMKAKRYVEAIDVCHKILAKFPDYPRIEKEILEKSRVALRP